VVEKVRAMKAKEFVIDGELIIVDEGALSFEALQLSCTRRRAGWRSSRRRSLRNSCCSTA
jgi:ATP-dependent DNA ligase